jgi:hypothetical protein
VSAIALTTRGYKVRGVPKADLNWSGTSVAVDVYRNDVPLQNASNITSQPFTDTLSKGSGTYTYKVCEHGSTATCSNTSTVVF